MKLSDRFYHILDTLGMDDIQYPVFYSAPIGIRFDIGDSSDFDVYCKKRTVNPLYIKHCLNKSTQIMDALSSPPDLLAIRLYYADESGLDEEIADILSSAKLPYPQEITKREIIQDDEQSKIAMLFWDLGIAQLSKERLLKEIIISDLGGEHLLTASVFWLWSGSNIMFHLYDDRGADLVASEKSAIQDIYTRFYNWILEYDKERITSTFEGE